MVSANGTIREAVGIFERAEDLERTIDELLGAGFDRADLSLLAAEPTVQEKLGDRYRRAEALADEPGAPRTAYVSTEAIGDAGGGLIGGLMYLGAVAAAGGIVASGGTLAGAIVAAALAGGAGGPVGSALARLIGEHRASYLQAQLERGGLLLWVRTRDPAHEGRAVEILARHSAHDVHIHDVAMAGVVGQSIADFEQALLDPTQVFAAPEAVLARGDLSREQKLLILRRWEYDARELEVAADEGMVGGDPDLLDRVLSALQGLGEPPAAAPAVPPTRHGG